MRTEPVEDSMDRNSSQNNLESETKEKVGKINLSSSDIAIDLDLNGKKNDSGKEEIRESIKEPVEEIEVNIDE